MLQNCEIHDKNVYMITDKAIMNMSGNYGTVDNGHPNDLGFASLAQALGDVIEKNHCIQF